MESEVKEFVDENNKFKQYTDRLANKLLKKNHDYGNSYDTTIDIYGPSAIGMRLHDKYSRIERILTGHEPQVDDESVQDTLLDLAGYSILALNYLDEHKEVAKILMIDHKN